MQRLINQFLKFGVVGIIAFAIDYGIMVLLVELFGMNPVLAAGISFVVSVIFNYVASMRYVFTHRKDLSRQAEFAIFVVLSAIGLALNEFLMWVGVDVLLVSYLIVKLVATFLVMIWNFVSRKKWLDAPEGGYELDPDFAREVADDLEHAVDGLENRSS